jgi:PKD repeat protein
MRGLILLLTLTCLLALYACKTDDLTSGGSKPTISSMTPTQVNRGEQNVTGHIQGSNYNGIVAVDLDAGISIHETKIISTSELEVRFSVNGDAPTGKKTVRVTTLRGAVTNSDILSINDNKAPNAVFTVNPSKGPKNTLFTFDGGGSNDPDGQITGYSWDFGDNRTASGREVTHKFDAGGNFNVKLTVTDDHQGTGSAQKEIAVENVVPPIARFSYSPHAGPVSTVFQFDGSGSVDQDGRITNYEWDFKDGTKATGKLVKHKYAHVDTFSVKLTVKDNSGLESYVEKELDVKGQPPVADFTVNPAAGDINTVFQFDGGKSKDSDGPVASYDWNFGDGSTDTGKNVSHKYSKEANFSVKLLVKDNSGMEDSTTSVVSVGSGGGGGGGGVCTVAAKDNGFIYGTVVGVSGLNAIVQLPAGSTCANSFYKCGDMRNVDGTGLKEFFGIIKTMTDLGGGKFSIYNDCPLNWPPAIGTRVFLYYKRCTVNHC